MATLYSARQVSLEQVLWAHRVGGLLYPLSTGVIGAAPTFMQVPTQIKTFQEDSTQGLVTHEGG
jgi:hypothetical protein